MNGSMYGIWMCTIINKTKKDEQYNYVFGRVMLLPSCWWPSNKKTSTEKNCSIDGCEKSNLTSNVESVRGLKLIARVGIFREEGQFEDTFAAYDTVSTQTWADEHLQDKLEFCHETVSLNVTRIHGTKITKSRVIEASRVVDMGRLNVCKTKARCSKSQSKWLRTRVYTFNKMKKISVFDVFWFQADWVEEICNHCRPKCLWTIRTVEYTKIDKNKPWASKLPRDRQWYSTIERLATGRCVSCCKRDNKKIPKSVKMWWHAEPYGTPTVADKRIKEDKLTTENLTQRLDLTLSDMKSVYNETMNKFLF